MEKSQRRAPVVKNRKIVAKVLAVPGFGVRDVVWALVNFRG
jgi:hypothetical protein